MNCEADGNIAAYSSVYLRIWRGAASIQVQRMTMSGHASRIIPSDDRDEGTSKPDFEAETMSRQKVIPSLVVKHCKARVRDCFGFRAFR